MSFTEHSTRSQGEQFGQGSVVNALAWGSVVLEWTRKGSSEPDRAVTGGGSTLQRGAVQCSISDGA